MTTTGLNKKYELQTYDQCVEFANFIMNLAKILNHHPEIKVSYKAVEVSSYSHDVGQVTDRDHKLMSDIDKHYDSIYGSEQDAKTQTDSDFNLDLIKIFTDGGSRGNPGPSASGFVIYDADDKIIVRSASYIGVTTNNQAEYISIRNALQYASKISPKEVHAFMDSQLVINQLNGIYKVKNQDLWPIYKAVKDLSDKLPKVTFSHVPRENNKVADALVNESLDKSSDILYNE